MALQPIFQFHAVGEEPHWADYWLNRPISDRLQHAFQLVNEWYNMNISDDFLEFVQVLNQHGVRYLLVGGYAVAVHGYVRFTKDMDIWLEQSLENAERMIAVFDSFFGDSHQLAINDFVDDKTIWFGNEPQRIDLLKLLPGVQFEECWERRISAEISNIPINVIDRASLITNKRTVGRYQDLADAENLERD